MPKPRSSEPAKKIECGDEVTVTNIGTLEWSMGDGTISPSNLEAIRPTIEDDVKSERLATAQYELNTAYIRGDFNQYITNAMIYVAVHVLMILLKDGMNEGKVLLCFAKRQLRWDVTIKCDAYKGE